MIARLRGRLVANTPEGLVLDVGGVGYLVAATPAASRRAEREDEASLHTYLHVREDALQLYGFADASERELFVQLRIIAVAENDGPVLEHHRNPCSRERAIR